MTSNQGIKFTGKLLYLFLDLSDRWNIEQVEGVQLMKGS